MLRQTKIKIVIMSSLIVSTSLVAAEKRIGIGALIDSSAGFFIPIETNDWLIEPSISAKKSKTSSVNLLDDARSERDSRTATLGVGIYKNIALENNTTMYYGARVGLIKRIVKETREASLLLELPASSSESDETGYFIAPTIGIQYFFIPQFSAGIDLTFQFTKTDGEETEVSNGFTLNADAENTSYATTASVIVRYMF